MTHKTKGIVIKTIKYGETSLVVTLLTELFGVQTYMVNGIRTAKKGGARAGCFQPAAILDLVVYHNENKSMQRIKEFGWAVLYNHILSDVIKNSIACYMMELLQKCLKQPESNTDLFDFCEDALLQLDAAPKTTAANFPLFFTLHLAHFFGFRISDNYSPDDCFLDLQEGHFIDHQPLHPHFITDEGARVTSHILKVMQPYELESFSLNHLIRRQLLLQYQSYYALHLPEFGQLKTLLILHEVL